MAYSVIPKVRRDGKLVLKDGGTTTLEVEYEDGNLTLTGLPTKEAQTIIRDRGSIVAVRKGDSEPVASGSFTIHFRQFTASSDPGSVLDFINQTGNYSSNVSTGNTGTPRVEFYCIDIDYEVDGETDGLTSTPHKASLTKCVVSATSLTEGDPTALSFEFVAYGGLTLAQAT